MLHNEHLRKADELYEIRHDNDGNAIHVYIKDGEAIIFPTLNDFIMYVCFGDQKTERKYMLEDELAKLYESDDYDYISLFKDTSNDDDDNDDDTEVNITDEHRKALESSGYFTKNLWHIDDVKMRYNCTDEQAMAVLGKVMQGEFVTQSVHEIIHVVANDMKLEPKDDE